jgi:hypothetical protein
MPTSLQLFLAIDERRIHYLVHNTSLFIGKTKFKKKSDFWSFSVAHRSEGQKNLK